MTSGNHPRPPMRAAVNLAIAVAGVWLAGGIALRSQSFDLPGTQPLGSSTPASAQIQHLFVPPVPVPMMPHGLLACANCHATANLARPIEPWQGSMMSQSARDPLFYAQLDLTNHDGRPGGPRPAVAGMADMCLRCHSPKGWLEGRSTTLSGLGFNQQDLFGVQCHVCHRLVDPQTPMAALDFTNILNGLTVAAPGLTTPGIPPTFGNGMYVMDPKHTRRGPYSRTQMSAHSTQVVEDGLDWTAVDTSTTLHPAKNSAFHRSGNLCGTCHDVSNPVDCSAGFGGQDTQKCFPIERTWTEWRHSAFAARGEAGTCQSCHMSGPLNGVGFGDPCEAASLLGHLNDIHVHDLTGGNDFIPRVIEAMKQRYEAPCPAPGDPNCANFRTAVQGLYPNAGDVFTDVNVPALNAGRARVARTLKRAAYLDAPSVSPALTVRVTNRTGHKLPTGYPEGRRMWLNARFLGSTGSLLAESGRYDAATGTLSHDQNLDGLAGGTRPYDVVNYTDAAGTPLATGRPTKVWEGRMRHQPTDTEFHFALNDEIRMDNRIPPEGWNLAGYTDNRALPVIPPVYTMNGWQTDYPAGVSHDEFSYDLPAGTDRVELGLYYQTASREYIEALRDDNPNTLTAGGYNRGSLLYEMWERTGRSEPVRMARRVRAVADMDGDGLSDGWETQYTVGGMSPGGANDDPDGDGLSNWQEFQQGSNPQDGNDPQPGGVRKPVDIALVIDLSGSMNDFAPGTTIPKIQILKDSVTLFLETWKEYAVPGDRIGVVYFETNATQFGAGPLLRSFVNEWSNIRSDVQSKTAAGWTAMGAGLHTALQGLTDPMRRRHVILFSNGMQNHSPMIMEDVFGDLVIRDQPVGGEVTGISNVTIGAGVDYSLQHGVKLHSIGIGVAPNSGGTAWHDLLRDIASQPGIEGKHNFITRAFELEGTFLEDLTTALRTNSLEYVLEDERTVNVGTPQVFDIPVNQTATRFSLVVSWSGQSAPAPTLRLTRPDGQVEDLAPITRGGSFYRIITRYLEPADANTDRGVWKLQVDLAQQGTGVAAKERQIVVPPSLQLRVHAVLDDADLKYQFFVPGRRMRIGSPLLVTAVATQGTQMLKVMDRITVSVDSPRRSVGEALAKSRHQLRDTAGVDQDLRASPFSLKMFAAFSDPAFRDRLATRTTSYTLQDDGRDGDDTAGDGMFSRILDVPQVPGHYRLHFTMVGHTASGERFVREETHSIMVQIGAISPDRSRIRRVREDGRDVVMLEPRDDRGNVLGPGYTTQMVIRAGGRQLTVEDMLDGRYRAALPAGFGPADAVAIVVNGDRVHDGPVRELGVFENIPWWVWLILLLLVVLVALIVIVRARRRP